MEQPEPGWRCDSTGALKLLRLLAALGAAASVAACTSISDKVSGTMSELPAVGLPSNAPERPATPFAYPAVHERPPAREAAVLNVVEQQKLEDDLLNARDRQQATTGRPAPWKKKPVPPPTPGVTPTSSTRTIY